MITKETLRKVIDDLHEEILEAQVNARDIDFEPHGNYVFVGLRRAGKSYILFQRIKQLLAEGYGWNRLIYVNFEDERLGEMTTGELDLILETHYERYEDRPMLFLDEIQNIPHWDKFVRRLADAKYTVYVTGSNSRMLSDEVATTLGGRFLIHEVYPYSYSEYLRAHAQQLPSADAQSTRQRGEAIRQFQTYFQYGGLPEISLFNQKRSWLRSLYQKVFFGDLIARNKVRNDHAVSLMVKKMAESIGQPLSYSRIAGIVSAAAAGKVDVRSIIDYTGYAEASWLILPVRNFAAKLTAKESIAKYYFIDNGILNLFLLEGEGMLLENVVAVELFRRYGHEKAVYYYEAGVEMDFYVPDAGLAIQVAYTLADVRTAERELEPLRKFAEHLAPRRMLIITFNERATFSVGDRTIEALPVWQWLLEDWQEE